MQAITRTLVATLLLCAATSAHAQVRANPLNVRFYTQPVGVLSGPVETTLTNEGEETQTVDGLVMHPLDPFQGAGGTCEPTPFQLAPKASCTLLFTFRPQDRGDVETTVRFSTPSHGLYAFWLSGTGVMGNLRLNPSSIRFFDTHVGQTSGEGGVTVANEGDYALEVLSISEVSAPFARVGGTCGTPPFTVQAGDGCTLSYNFSPFEVAESRQTVRFTANIGGSLQSLDLAGDSDPGLQALTFPAQSAATRGFAANRTFPIDPLATSAMPNGGEPVVYASLTGNVCSVSGSTVTMLALGTCTLAADQAGTANYDAAAQVTTAVQLVARDEADVWVQKTAAVAEAAVGDTVAYTIRVGNHGPLAADGVTLLDLPPSRLGNTVWECVEAIGTTCPLPPSGDGGIDTALDLPAGASLRFELLGTVLPEAGPGGDAGVLLNTASVSLPAGSPLTDPETANNENTASVTVVIYAVHTDGFEAPPQR